MGNASHLALSQPYIQSTALHHLIRAKLYPSQTRDNHRKHIVEYFVCFIAACTGSLSCHFYTNAKIYNFLNLLQRYFYYLQCFLLLFSWGITNETSETKKRATAEKREDQNKREQDTSREKGDVSQQEQMSLGEDTWTEPQECVSLSALEQHLEAAENYMGCAKG